MKKLSSRTGIWLLCCVCCLFIGFAAACVLRNAETKNIVVVSSGDTQTERSNENFDVSADDVIYPVNLNTADFDALCLVPGFTEKRAMSILEYRKKHGAFRDVTDILEISGIGEATFNQAKDYICV